MARLAPETRRRLMTAAVGVLVGAIVGIAVNTVSVHTGGEWLVWLAAVLVALGVLYRYIVRPAKKAARWCATTAEKADQILDSYPRVRDLVQQIVDTDLPAIESRLRVIEQQGAQAAEILAAAADTGETPITIKEHP